VLTLLLAGAGDRDPGHRSTAADRPGPKPISSQAARATSTPVNDERGAELCKRFSRLRRRGEDVRDKMHTNVERGSGIDADDSWTLGLFLFLPILYTKNYNARCRILTAMLIN
jgi:hypothetical protein